jgi:hypothetical protein
MNRTVKLSFCFGLVILLLTKIVCIGQAPFNIGTIQPGGSIVVYYDVTINTPLVPPTTSAISHQGTVSGSNFANVLTDDPSTAAAHDATIVLLNTPLPVIFGEFRASQKEHTVALTWKILSEENTSRYEIERSADAKAFGKIGEVVATGGAGIRQYSFTDELPGRGNNYYRLKVLDWHATYAYTRMIKVSIDVAESASNLYPNPVVGKVVNLELLNMVKGRYDLKFYNLTGQLIYSKSIEHTGGSASQLVTIPENVQAGIYQVEIKSEHLKTYKKLAIN